MYILVLILKILWSIFGILFILNICNLTLFRVSCISLKILYVQTSVWLGALLFFWNLSWIWSVIVLCL